MRMSPGAVVMIVLAGLGHGFVAPTSTVGAEPRPGLLVVNATVRDQHQFAAYAAKSGPLVRKHKGAPLLRATNAAALAGDQPYKLLIAFRFPSKAAIAEFYRSADYQALIPLRTTAADVIFTAYEIDQEEAPAEGKALLAVNLFVKDAIKFSEYAKASRPVVTEHGGKPLLRAVNPEVLFGENRYKILVLFTFPDRRALRAFYGSEAYQQLIPTRTAGADAVFTGYDL